MKSSAEAPLKWRKYKLLESLGLLSNAELLGIGRFPVDMVDDIRERALQDLRSNCMVVVKLVPQDRGGQLPNYRLAAKSDLEELTGFLSRSASVGAKEAWVCGTPMRSTELNVAGRLSFESNRAVVHQVLEMVWRTSPRLIEALGESRNITYVRASRVWWGRRYRIDEIKLKEGVKEVSVRNAFWTLVRRLERWRDRICALTETIEENEIQSYSIEFKLIGEKLEIIDWDTSNDKKVLTKA